MGWSLRNKNNRSVFSSRQFHRSVVQTTAA
ncbi:hypothetical protein EG68_12357 [Paragonimus skrjabini miyazakii]|uniref:Uncharacterized protein n=1 Tax=Paragonimus skrjabini miyazakii TaxID=59628 RepID=A0A8S9YF44_9TREM|nr:hypothetical protein EG68_11314 [Paragonimus skrjabini miyazakii]KAF7239492.1 hypothetical protein EG68_12357 [Paragonimus skrjabini miyazakii]